MKLIIDGNTCNVLRGNLHASFLVNVSKHCYADTRPPAIVVEDYGGRSCIETL